MTKQDRDLTALIGSRICHDLISPLGAIGNGVELLQLSGLGDSPEMALIAESVANANLRIRFFRVAFGAAAEGQSLAEREIRAVLAPGADGRKIEYDWQPAGDLPRMEVKLAFLALQCFETAMPWGGQVTITRQDGRWTMSARGDRLNVNADLWSLLSTANAEIDVPPAQVHFALIRPELQRQKRAAVVQTTDQTITLSF
ncbi:histidine phosphotransferase ChpT [Aliiroseovarius halocynthiae]|uniref:Histidine phosphotransferase n=1 Tax=Aliiroseovarius halocynthiae TaxID=985055 RepID=A0A545SVZ6_9RHOB|nr:histidine phosphotransferase family protein [Aliiroseovarius halocynthiae]TQV69142.1 histidine phosphotransferase [Aliiroseovarius halocynthiae]SMR71898.1 histidine phosphotransferase ChpT [Aliiroseovarius halocynthiae]